MLLVGNTITEGAGFTKTVLVAAGPGQPSFVAIALYVTEPTAAPVAIKVLLMLAPVPGLVFPLAPMAVEVQAKVLLPGNEELKVIFIGLPVQTVSFKTAKLTVGTGLTRTLVCLVADEQPFREETTEKVAL